MSAIRRDLIHAVINSAIISINGYHDFHGHHYLIERKILTDNILKNDEKTEAIRLRNKSYDREKILYGEGKRRICENCNKTCLATSFCEYCIQNHLQRNFSNWTSGNIDIDNLIKKCQNESNMPDMVIEWIPYNKLENIKYLTIGGFSEIYTADWTEGGYNEWDPKRSQLLRFGKQKVILKRLENIERANQSWFEEAKSHLTLSNKCSEIIPCYGLTQNPNGSYMLVMDKADLNLREYLQQNNNKLTWNGGIKIIYLIIDALYYIHKAKLIHKDLHSGNILYSQFNDSWVISDLGFCGPADKSLTSIYGNLPYVAPEVINRKEYTYKSDIYSIAMLMWEISSGRPPFNNHEHDYYLATNIINGMRPKITSEIPLKYKNLMVQCWDANPLKRPDIDTLREKITEITLYYHNNPNELPQLKTKLDKETNHANTSGKLFTSTIHKFENLPEPKNATEEQQEAFHSKLYDFNIPDNIDDLGQSSNHNNEIQKVINNTTATNLEEELYNNPNLYSDEQED
ncbi:hypothetical protein RclHR1_18040001 [Rhizophagus clarus]|uniref:Protein kinase domain-containing protein n=1 Tax=Rhizophagus clarus TaxID=94130 RepID=A0A2Z6QQP5_9GLOM|nr:hypothetical protein RclHR1_18040001 [Rhizophagus clarus]